MGYCSTCLTGVFGGGGRNINFFMSTVMGWFEIDNWQTTSLIEVIVD